MSEQCGRLRYESTFSIASDNTCCHGLESRSQIFLSKSSEMCLIYRGKDTGEEKKFRVIVEGIVLKHHYSFNIRYGTTNVMKINKCSDGP